MDGRGTRYRAGPDKGVAFGDWFEVQTCSVIEDLHIEEPLEHV